LVQRRYLSVESMTLILADPAAAEQEDAQSQRRMTRRSAQYRRTATIGLHTRTS
jgi:hypothetical protein